MKHSKYHSLLQVNLHRYRLQFLHNVHTYGRCGNRTWQFPLRFWWTVLNIRNKKNYRVSAVKFHLIYTFYFLITFPMLFTMHVIYSCNCDRQRTITSQMFVKASLFQPWCALSSFVHHKRVQWYSELNCNYDSATSGANVVCLCSYDYFWSWWQKCIACQDHLRDVIFKYRANIKWHFTADTL